jgi:hypothetical protein
LPGALPTNPPHNAHQYPILATVNYPYHPRFGEQIQVVGIRRHRGERCCVIAVNDKRRELIPEWMTNPHWAEISIVLWPQLDVSALRNLRRLLNCEILSLLDRAKPETRRDNEDSKISSIADHLERYGIADINSEADSK